MSAQYSNPRLFTKYRLYLPGWWSIIEVLETAADYVEGEPVILNTPALAGDWEVGYCTFTNYVRALANVMAWHDPQAVPL